MQNASETLPIVLTIKDSYRFTLLRLTLQGKQDNYGFVDTFVEAEMGGFQASFMTNLNTGELAQFERQLAGIHAELSGKAILTTMEGVLEVKAKIDVQGRLQWDVRLQHPAGIGATLQFEMHNDQSYLPSLLSDFRQVREKYLPKDPPS